MLRFAAVALAVTLSTGLWAPGALAATEPQPSQDPGMEQPSAGMQGDRPQGDQPFQRMRGHRGGPGMKGQPPQGEPGMNGQQAPDGQRRGGPGMNGQQPPDGQRWGGPGMNGQQPQNGDQPQARPSARPGEQGDGAMGDGQRSRGQWQRPHGPRHGRPAGDTAENDSSAS